MVHRKEMILKCRTEMAIERMACLVCACSLASLWHSKLDDKLILYAATSLLKIEEAADWLIDHCQ